MSRFPNVAAIVFGALAAVALTGCIKTKTVINLKADGSGTATITAVADLSKMDELKQMMEGMGMGGGDASGPGAEMDDMMDFKKTAAAIKGMEGLRLISQKEINDTEKKTRGAEIVVAFDNLKALGRSGLMQNSASELKKNADGSYTLIQAMIPEQMEGMDLNDPQVQQQMEMAKGMMPMFEPFVGGLEVVTIVKLPSAITATNGVKGETGNSVEWKLGFADMTDLSKMTRTVTFSGEGVTLAAFKVEAKAAREAMEAAKKKIEGTETPGAQPLAGSVAARAAAAEARVAVMESAHAAAEAAVRQAEAAAQKARIDMEKARIDMETARKALEALKTEAK